MGKMRSIFSGKVIDEHLENVSKELDIIKGKIEDKINNKNNLSSDKKNKTGDNNIGPSSFDSTNSLSKEDAKVHITKEDENVYSEIDAKESVKEKNQVGARVENSKIIVTQNSTDEDSEPITVKPCDGIQLFINGQPCDTKTLYRVTQFDEIKYTSRKTEAIRNVKVNITDDKMKAYINVEYIPEYIYELDNKPTHKNLALKTKKVEGEYPAKYTSSEMKEILRHNNITEGIIYKKLIEVCAFGSNKNVLIAQGIPAIDDKTSEVRILFNLEEKKILHESSNEKIDYKNVYSISNIEAGQLLAEIIPGEIGSDGKNVCGETLKRKTVKSKPIKAGEGCKIENNKIIATKMGRPCSKNGVLSVNNVYTIDDVNMKSGNIHFVGDVDITGSVNTGMEVKAGNTINVGQNIDNSKITASGEINVKGNVINSTLFTGQVDMEKKLYLDTVNEYKDIIEQIINAVNELIGSGSNTKRVGELVKLLIEKKFKTIPKLSLNVITRSICQDDGQNGLVDFIRNKMMMLNVLKINSLREIEEFKDLLENEIDFLSDDMIIPADIIIGYCQDCTIKSTGNIIVNGKGEYVSSLIALKNIEFISNSAVARGGILSAGGNIKLGSVGSQAGVSTRLEVPKEGIITANIAYSNTVFCFGKRSKTLEVSAKNVKAYMKEDGEIVIDKFVL